MEWMLVLPAALEWLLEVDSPPVLKQPLLLYWLQHLELAPEDVQALKLEPALLPGLVLELEEEKRLAMCLPF